MGTGPVGTVTEPRPVGGRSVSASAASPSDTARSSCCPASWSSRTTPGVVSRRPHVRQLREQLGSSGSAPELARFLAHADTYAEGERFAAEPWLRAAFRLTLCGLRGSEVLGLDWSAVNLADGSVEVRQSRVKTGRAQTTATHDPKSSASRRTVPVESIHTGRVRRQVPGALPGGGCSGDPAPRDPAHHRHGAPRRGRAACRCRQMLGHEVTTHLALRQATDDSAQRAALRLGREPLLRVGRVREMTMMTTSQDGARGHHRFAEPSESVSQSCHRRHRTEPNGTLALPA